MLIPGLSSSWVDQQSLPAVKSTSPASDSDLNDIKEVGQRFTFKGRHYTVRENDNLTWRFEEDAHHPLFSFYHAISDRIIGCTLDSRESQLAKKLLDHVKPDRTVIPIRSEAQLSTIQFGQRFNFEGRNYTVKKNIQGQWRVVEDPCHPLFTFFAALPTV